MAKQTDKATPEDAGCWIDAHWGQYGTARLIEIAASYGWVDDCTFGYDKPGEEDSRTAVDIAAAHLASIGPSESPEISSDEFEYMLEAADAAEEWMNAHVAPAGYSFGWFEGEFFLWSFEQWEEESY